VLPSQFAYAGPAPYAFKKHAKSFTFRHGADVELSQFAAHVPPSGAYVNSVRATCSDDESVHTSCIPCGVFTLVRVTNVPVRVRFTVEPMITVVACTAFAVIDVVPLVVAAEAAVFP